MSYGARSGGVGGGIHSEQWGGSVRKESIEPPHTSIAFLSFCCRPADGGSIERIITPTPPPRSHRALHVLPSRRRGSKQKAGSTRTNNQPRPMLQSKCQASHLPRIGVHRSAVEYGLKPPRSRCAMRDCWRSNLICVPEDVQCTVTNVMGHRVSFTALCV